MQLTIYFSKPSPKYSIFLKGTQAMTTQPDFVKPRRFLDPRIPPGFPTALRELTEAELWSYAEGAAGAESAAEMEWHLAASSAARERLSEIRQLLANAAQKQLATSGVFAFQPRRTLISSLQQDWILFTEKASSGLAEVVAGLVVAANRVRAQFLGEGMAVVGGSFRSLGEESTGSVRRLEIKSNRGDRIIVSPVRESLILQVFPAPGTPEGEVQVLERFADDTPDRDLQLKAKVQGGFALFPNCPARNLVLVLPDGRQLVIAVRLE